MILSMREQTLIFLSTVALGFFMGLIFDVFRIIRKTVKHANLITQLEDILYWLLVSFIMFYYMLNKNYGEIRFFSILGAGLGVILYFAGLSPFVMGVSMAVVNFLKKVLTVVFKILLFPIKLILRILLIPVHFVKPHVLLAAGAGKKVLQKTKTCAKIKTKSTISHLKNDFKIIFKKV